MNRSIVESAVQNARALSGADFAVEVREYAKTYDADLRKLQSAQKSGKKQQVWKLQHRLLNSYGAVLTCLVRCLPHHGVYSVHDIHQIASTLSPWKDPGEVVRVWAEPKGIGDGWRPLCAFGPMRSALQLLCADILAAKWGLDPVNYLAKGRGADIASDKVVNLIEKEGFTHFAKGDVKDFFRSVQQKYLKEATGLPEAVIHNCLLIGLHVLLESPTTLLSHITIDDLVGAAREGLPQGSRGSQIIASQLLGPVLRETASEDCIIVYGDDFAIAASNQKEASAYLGALEAAFGVHPAGPFHLKSEVASAMQGFDFLKYRYRLDAFTGMVRVRPSTKSYLRFEERVAIKVMNAAPGAYAKPVAQYRFRWMKAFPRWPWNALSKEMLKITTIKAIEAGLAAKPQT